MARINNAKEAAHLSGNLEGLGRGGEGMADCSRVLELLKGDPGTFQKKKTGVVVGMGKCGPGALVI